MKDNQTISLTQGNGGAASRRLVREVFTERFKMDRICEDAALIFDEKLAFSTDTFVVQPEVFPGGDIGKLAVCGTVNDLAVRGAIPRWLSSAWVVPSGYSTTLLEQLAESMAQTARNAGVAIVTGDTKVVDASELQGIIVNTAGIGVTKYRSSPVNVNAGDLIIVSGNIGDHAAALLSAREGIYFDDLPESDCAVLTELAGLAFEAGATFIRDATRGGVSAVMHEIVETRSLDIHLQGQSIPVHPRVEELASLLNLDCLGLANEGKLVVVAPEDKVLGGQGVLAALRSNPLGRKAQVVGEVRSGVGKVFRRTGERLAEVREDVGNLPPRLC